MSYQFQSFRLPSPQDLIRATSVLAVRPSGQAFWTPAVITRKPSGWFTATILEFPYAKTLDMEFGTPEGALERLKRNYEVREWHEPSISLRQVP